MSAVTASRPLTGKRAEQEAWMGSYTPFKGRTITPGQLVAVYRNLHHGGWSIKDTPHGLVLGHADRVSLQYASFRVYPSGHARAQREGRRNVHAFVLGVFCARPPFGCTSLARYNLERGHFELATDPRPLTSAAFVDLHADGHMYLSGERH